MRFLLLILILIVSARTVQAEETGAAIESISRIDSLATITEIKGEVQALIKEHNALKGTYDQLNQEYMLLLGDVHADQREIQKLKDYANMTSARAREQASKAQALKDELDHKRNQLLLKESQVAQLKGQLLDLEHHEDLWKLKEEELAMKQRELEMSLKYKEFELKELTREEEEEELRYQKKIERLVEEEKELLRLIEEAQAKAEALPKEISQWQEKHGQWQRQAQALEQEEARAGQREEILETKKQIALKTIEGQQWSKKEEEARLQELVTKLDLEYNELSANLERSKRNQALQNDMIQDIIRIDQENQELRQKIEDLQQKISAVK